MTRVGLLKETVSSALRLSWELTFVKHLLYVLPMKFLRGRYCRYYWERVGNDHNYTAGWWHDASL